MVAMGCAGIHAWACMPHPAWRWKLIDALVRGITPAPALTWIAGAGSRCCTARATIIASIARLRALLLVFRPVCYLTFFGAVIILIYIFHIVAVLILRLQMYYYI
jgi:hypothetical protein